MIAENCHGEETPNSSAPKNIDESLATSTAMTAERACYQGGNLFIKRGLRLNDYKTTIEARSISPD